MRDEFGQEDELTENKVLVHKYLGSTALALGVHVSSPKYFKVMYAVNFKLRMAYFKIDVRTESILIQISTHKYSKIRFWQELSSAKYLYWYYYCLKPLCFQQQSLQ